MKKTVSLLLAVLIAAAAFGVNALAYSSPFDIPAPASASGVNSAAEVRYGLREGGTFIYCNNPEELHASELGRALMIVDDVSGDVYFTAENRNLTGQSVIMGLQLRNDSGSDVKVTVRNLGYQVGIDWNGQQEWTDFFDTTFSVEPKKNNDYYFENVFSPAGFKAETYTVPTGKYIYVMGGTSYDAYNRINVGKSANRHCPNGDLVNGTVFFTVDGPATGVSVAYVLYLRSTEPVTSKEQVGYVAYRDGKTTGRQYLGSAPYLCAETSLAWNVDDSFANGKRLPVKYSVEYYNNVGSYGAYGEYKNPMIKNVSSDKWFTHLNPASNNSFVGTDMMPFNCITDDGKSVVIDVRHNDGVGSPANIGNWMVVYEESMTFTNSGDSPRAFNLYMRNNGLTAVNVRDGSGGLLKSLYHYNKDDVVYSLNVLPGETKTMVVEYVLLANSYGSQEHYVTVTKGIDCVLGDVDGNGRIGAADYAMAKRSVIGTFKLNPDQASRADVSGDGAVTAKDYAMIKRHVLKTFAIPGSEGK